VDIHFRYLSARALRHYFLSNLPWCIYWILTVNTFQQGDVNDVMKKDPYDAIFARRLLKTK
jgi:hypothetical protein